MQVVGAHDIDAAADASRNSAGITERRLTVAFDAVALVAVGVGIINNIGPWWVIGITASVMLIGLLDGTYRRPRLNPRLFGAVRSGFRTGIWPLAICALGLGLELLPDEPVIVAVQSTVALVLARWLSGLTITALRRRGRLHHRVLLVGSGDVADEVVAGCARIKRSGLEVVARIDGTHLVELVNEVERSAIDIVVVAYSSTRDHELLAPLQLLRQRRVEVFVVPRLFGFGSASGDTRTESCGGVPLVWVPQLSWRREQLTIKRTFDIVVATIALIATAPLMLAIALGVKFTSPGPIIFRQTRLGRDLKAFEMYKFRSMRHGIDPTANQSGGDSPDRTRFGIFLRRTSLDELPQLINVIKGDMSLVGPRPEQPHFVHQFLDVPGYAARHRVPVGITGWAQVNELRGASTSLRDRAAYDNYYIEHWSPWLDVEILLRTIAAAIRGS